MPSESPTPALIWDRRIRFVSIDTDVLKANGFQFEKAPLNQLEHQLPDGLAVHLTPVVAEEVRNHRLRPLKEALAQVESGAKAIERVSGIAVAPLTHALESLDILATAERKFKEQLLAFVTACNGTLLDWTGADMGRLFDDYFAEAPPFEARKKSEFPDAAALQLLERKAAEDNTCGIVVSNDKGWEAYCANSKRLYCLSSLDALTELFVATGSQPDDVIVALRTYLDDSSTEFHQRLHAAIEDHVQNAAWHATEWISEVGGRLDTEAFGEGISAFSLYEDIDAWRDSDGAEWIFKLVAKVTAQVHVHAEVMAWDSVDRDEVGMGTDEHDVEEVIEVEVYLSCADRALGPSPASWNLTIEIAHQADYELSFREVGID